MLKVNFELREKIAALSDKYLYYCISCGICTASCPFEISIRRIIRNASIGEIYDVEQIWNCTLCKQCSITCPRYGDPSRVIWALRSLLYDDLKAPANVSMIFWKILEDKNPLGGAKSERVWIANLFEHRDYSSEKCELAIYTCCTFIYDTRLQHCLKCLVKLLKDAGVNFKIIYENIYCCGDVVYQCGDTAFLKEIATKNLEVIEKAKVDTLLTISPHCYNMFKNIYPKLNAKPSMEILHYTQYLLTLLHDDKLNFSPLNIRATYHDPCFLARYNGIINEPREILNQLGVDIIEMEHNKKLTLCCGGGGGSFWIENKYARDVTKRRLQEAINTNTNILITSCPYCIRMFEDEAKVERLNIKIFDLSELFVNVVG